MIRYLTKFSLQNLLKFDKETRDNISAIPSPVGSVEWENVENKPTTVEGYGITDVYTKSEVDDIEDRVSDNEDDISELYNKVDTIDGDVDALSSTVGTLSTKIYNAESDIDTLENTTASLNTAIDGLDSRVSDNEDNIADIKSDMISIVKSEILTRTTDSLGRIESFTPSSVTVDNVLNVIPISPNYLTISRSCYGNRANMVYCKNASTDTLLANTSVSYIVLYYK